MPPTSTCVVAPKSDGEKIRRRLLKLELLDHGLRIKSDDEFIYFPVTEKPRGKIEGAKVKKEEFEPSGRRKSAEEMLGFHPSYEVIGDICILKHDSDKKIAKAILETHKNIKVMLRPLSRVTGTFRTKNYRVVAGEKRTETVYRENGCVFLVDVEKAYFSPRLANERARVTSLVSPDEVVLDMFAGVGCFAVQVAKKAEKVIAVDVNPHAVEYMKKNVELNKAWNVEVLEGDVRKLAGKLEKVDRVIMDFPTGASGFLGCAVDALKERGVIHYYDICSEGEIEGLAKKVAGRIKNAKVWSIEKRKIRPYAPYQYNVVLDVEIIRKETIKSVRSH